MKVVLADINESELAHAEDELKAAGGIYHASTPGGDDAGQQPEIMN